MIATFLALPRWTHGLIAVAVAVLTFLAWDAWDDRQAVKDARARHEAAAQVARDKAAAERARDAAANAANEKDLHHAIETAPAGGTLSPAALALNCERLRKFGRVPAPCRHLRGD